MFSSRAALVKDAVLPSGARGWQLFFPTEWPLSPLLSARPWQPRAELGCTRSRSSERWRGKERKHDELKELKVFGKNSTSHKSTQSEAHAHSTICAVRLKHQSSRYWQSYLRLCPHGYRPGIAFPGHLACFMDNKLVSYLHRRIMVIFKTTVTAGTPAIYYALGIVFLLVI